MDLAHGGGSERIESSRMAGAESVIQPFDRRQRIKPVHVVFVFETGHDAISMLGLRQFGIKFAR
jgi:hypothetical protein